MLAPENDVLSLDRRESNLSLKSPGKNKLEIIVNGGFRGRMKGDVICEKEESGTTRFRYVVSFALLSGKRKRQMI